MSAAWPFSSAAGRAGCSALDSATDSDPGYSRESGRRRRAGPELALRDPGTRRELTWLAVHGVTGPAPVVAVWAMLSALDYVFFGLRPMDPSRLTTFALSMSIVAIAVVTLMAVSLFRTGQARLARLLLDPDPARTRGSGSWPRHGPRWSTRARPSCAASSVTCTTARRPS
ncbi:sensor domain-containing protein [Nonomuraea dietziae]|uniref:sensor domain-containing protein n=1 Tax=Nonomuraea dietziae TaxID=65515 RepID=UPI0031D83CF8